MKVTDIKNGEIKTNTSLQLIALAVFFVVWLAMSLFIVIAVFPDLRIERFIERIKAGQGFVENDIKLLVLLFPVALLFFIKPLYQMFNIYHKYRDARITLDPFPGSAVKGGQIGGHLDLSHFDRAHSDQLQVTVNCIGVSYSKGSSSGNRRSESVKWRKRALTRVDHKGGGRAKIRFQVTLDETLPPSSESTEGSHIYWAVHFSAAIGDLDLNFVIPVAAEGGPEVSQYLYLSQAEEDKLLKQPPRPENVAVKESSRSLHLQYNPDRKSKFGTVFTLIGIFCLGVAAFMAYKTISNLIEADRSYFPAMVTTMIGFGFGLVGFGSTFWGIYTLFSRLIVDITDREISSERKFLTRSWVTKARHDQVADIKKTITTQVSSGQGGGATIYYQINAHLKDGGKMNLGDHIESQPEADRLLRLIKERVDYTPGEVVSPEKQELPEFVKPLMMGVKIFAAVTGLLTMGAFLLDFFLM
ncbi:MAG: hypothetical protein ABFS19_08395 [Thermodesulfobacteriota bacterium]